MNRQIESVAEELTQLGQERARAELRGDTQYVARLLASDFVGVGPLGFLLTREQWIDRLESGDLKYESLTWDEAQARVYGDAAVVIGRETSKATYKGMPIQGEFRETQVYVRQGGRWLLAGLQLSAIGQPLGPRQS